MEVVIDPIKLKAKIFDLPKPPEGSTYWDGVDAVAQLIDELTAESEDFD